MEIVRFCNPIIGLRFSLEKEPITTKLKPTNPGYPGLLPLTRCLNELRFIHSIRRFDKIVHGFPKPPKPANIIDKEGSEALAIC
jgi:hypothetical protein